MRGKCYGLFGIDRMLGEMRLIDLSGRVPCISRFETALFLQIAGY